MRGQGHRPMHISELALGIRSTLRDLLQEPTGFRPESPPVSAAKGRSSGWGDFPCLNAAARRHAWPSRRAHARTNRASPASGLTMTMSTSIRVDPSYSTTSMRGAATCPIRTGTTCSILVCRPIPLQAMAARVFAVRSCRRTKPPHKAQHSSCLPKRSHCAPQTTPACVVLEQTTGPAGGASAPGRSCSSLRQKAVAKWLSCIV